MDLDPAAGVVTAGLTSPLDGVLVAFVAVCVALVAGVFGGVFGRVVAAALVGCVVCFEGDAFVGAVVVVGAVAAVARWKISNRVAEDDGPLQKQRGPRARPKPRSQR